MGEDKKRVQGNEDDFDLDALLGDDDEDEDTDAGYTGGYGEDDEERIPKRKAERAIRKRIARERAKLENLAQQFRDTYGMTPEEVLEYGRRERERMAAGSVGTPGIAWRQGPNEAQPQRVHAVPEGVPTAPVSLDPVARKKIEEIDNWRRQAEIERQQEREALEFVRLFPDVKFEEIPKEVLARRSRGGLTLAEAYKLHIADQRVQEAMRKGAESALRDVGRKGRMRVEGPDVTGGAGDTLDTLTEEDREFLSEFGGFDSAKEFLAYKRKVERIRREQGLE